jgi:hypothetical protein
MFLGAVVCRRHIRTSRIFTSEGVRSFLLGRSIPLNTPCSGAKGRRPTALMERRFVDCLWQRHLPHKLLTRSNQDEMALCYETATWKLDRAVVLGSFHEGIGSILLEGSDKTQHQVNHATTNPHGNSKRQPIMATIFFSLTGTTWSSNGRSCLLRPNTAAC